MSFTYISENSAVSVFQVKRFISDVVKCARVEILAEAFLR